jgi:hypothetical protein
LGGRCRTWWKGRLSYPRLGRELKAAQVKRELKAAEDFFELAKNASSPFMRAHYRHVAERYLSSKGELREVFRQPAQ